MGIEAWRRIAAKLDARRSAVHWYDKTMYWLSATNESWLNRVQRSRYLDRLQGVVPHPPIFLLGFWRSGTTFLHELFCCDERFGFPSTYACLNPSHFLLTQQRSSSSKHKTHRPMDDMRYSWASPQEDEFALLAMGAPSPYEALLLPSLMDTPQALLDLRYRPTNEQECWKESFLLFLRLLTIQQDKRMVLKSPSHAFRLSVLSKLFPDALYVLIERNPYEVFASNLKLWQTLLDLYSLETYSPGEIETFVLSAYVLHEEAITEAMDKVHPVSIARVRYEDLVADPIREMTRLYRELCIEDVAALGPQLEKYLATVADYKRSRFFLSAGQKARLEDSWAEIIRQKGYTWCSDYITIREPACVA